MPNAVAEPRPALSLPPTEAVPEPDLQALTAATNQAPLLAGFNLYRQDQALREALARGDAGWADEALLARWQRIREVRDEVNKAIEAVRAAGGVGSSLQAEIVITAGESDHALLASLGDDLRFVTITSQARLARGDALAVAVTPSGSPKCERCWHWRADVGHDPKHPTLCGRCTSNLFGAGEPRSIA